MPEQKKGKVKPTEEELFVRRFTEKHSGLSPREKNIFELFLQLVENLSVSFGFVREMKEYQIKFHCPELPPKLPSMTLILDPNGIFCLVGKEVKATVLFENNDILPSAKELSDGMKKAFMN